MTDTVVVPRPEYPRPQFVRIDAQGNPDWLCLNGPWEFSIDQGDSGLDRGLATQETWEYTIQVPFCPESELSGLAHIDFMPAVWYRRTVTLPENWAGKSVVLHFGAVDYDATVWAIKEGHDEESPTTTVVSADSTTESTTDSASASVIVAATGDAVNNPLIEVGRHRGGFTPFACHLERAKVSGGDTVTLIVRARDFAQEPKARGKQSTKYAPHGCLYTRTTGIWQTVWLEALPQPAALRRARITPDIASGAFRIEQPLTNNPKGYRLRATVGDHQGQIAETTVRADLDFAPRLDLFLPADRQRLWGAGDPFLYDLTVELLDGLGTVVDSVRSYAGLRSVSIDGKAVKINGEPVFQRLILDQGYYPDGVMTAPTDAALIHDIEISMAVGFNGARLHQKVFEERFLYHADRLGYLVWGEFGDWGSGGYGPNGDHQKQDVSYPAQFLEALERDYSHPSIVGWCPLNETWQNMTDVITVLDDATRAMYLACKAMDTTRPVLDTSGYSHRVYETDIYDSHDYISETDYVDGLTNFTTRQGAKDWTPFVNPQYPGPKPNTTVWSTPYRGQPYFVSEFGGFKWVLEEDTDYDTAGAQGAKKINTWGYGVAPTTIEEFYQRFSDTCDVLLQNPNHFAFCYTQLTDIFPEENGIYTFGRKLKFDAERLKAILTQKAAIEATLKR